MTKQKTIALTFPHQNPKEADGINSLYQVVRVTDSTEYNPGQMLTKQQVDELCSAKYWTVSTKRPAPL